MKREFRKKDSRGRVQRWIIESQGNVYRVQDGLVDGKLKEWTTQTFDGVNLGKANAKSPEEVAKEKAERQILKKSREGYYEVDPKTGKMLVGEVEEESEVDFDNPSEALRFYKPLNNLNSRLERLLLTGEAWAVRKRNGNRLYAVTNTRGDVKLYTSSFQASQKDERGIGKVPGIPYGNRYPHILAALNALGMPPKTILLCEICCVAYVDTDGYDKDDLDVVNAVRGSLTPYALEFQEKYGYMGLCIWDIAFWGGQCLLTSYTYEERFSDIQTLVDDSGGEYLTYPEVAVCKGDTSDGLALEITSRNHTTAEEVVVEGTFQEGLVRIAKDRDWEGWVIHDPSVVMDEKAWNSRGKWDRPKSAGKLKPGLEADFIVRYDPKNKIGVPGKGKKSVGVGSVFCYLWDADKRKEVYVGKCGGGLSEEDVLKYADPKQYPLVWQIEFATWTKSGSLEHPRFVRERDDKEPEECLIQQNPEWEEQYP